VAHATAVAEPPVSFELIRPSVEVVRLVRQVDGLASVGIRDGPSQPRGPPSLI